MIQKPIDVLEQFPVRKSNQHKTAFIDSVTAYAKDHGYAVRIDSYKRGARNIVVGDQNSAK